jgi:uncharacterized protein (DUF1697 family)
MAYVALLRGINVGGRIIKTAELIACFESMGFDDVKTVLQSGNVIFASNESDPAKLKQKIEAGLTKAFNYPAKVWIVGTDELGKIIDANPFADTPPDYHQYIIFFENSLAESFATEAVGITDEAIQVDHGVVYWKVQKGQTLKSPHGKLLNKSPYRNSSTTRNINTVHKIYELMPAAENG